MFFKRLGSRVFFTIRSINNYIYFFSKHYAHRAKKFWVNFSDFLNLFQENEISKGLYNREKSVFRSLRELAWRSGCVMDCNATARGSIPGGCGVKTELHVLRNGQ